MEVKVKLKKLLNELRIDPPQFSEALGIEISINPQTAKQKFDYYRIENGSKKKIAEDEFYRSAGQYSNTIDTAIQRLIVERSNRRRFAPNDPKTMDILAWYDNKRKKYIITATSDDKSLQLEYVTGAKKWVKRQ